MNSLKQNLHSKYEDCFVSTCIEKGLIEGSTPPKWML
jgi:hypothetical protein